MLHLPEGHSNAHTDGPASGDAPSRSDGRATFPDLRPLQPTDQGYFSGGVLSGRAPFSLPIPMAPGEAHAVAERCKLRVLVIEDNTAMREVLEARLEGWGCEVRSASHAEAGRRALDRFDPDLVITDLVLPDATGLDLLVEILGDGPLDAHRRRVVLITAYGTIETAVEGMKRGAWDYLTKPLDYTALKRILDRIDAERKAGHRGPADDAGPTRPAAPPASTGGMVGQSSAQKSVLALIQTVAETDATVMIVGESGVGKELVARTIHARSARSDGPFVAVNAAAIPTELTEAEFFGHARGAFTGATEAREGLFQQADRGTLFLDEITEMPLPLQAKLLRALEERFIRPVGSREPVSCDVRILAATNRDPEAAIEQQKLRLDLYYRLNVFQIPIPPLRQRIADLPDLIRHFVEAFRVRHAFGGTAAVDDAAATTPDAQEYLAAYDWPGNIRELRNLVERAVLLSKGRTIGIEHLPPLPVSHTPSPPGGIVLPDLVTSAEAEKILILETLRRTGNNKAEAARRLGVDVKTIRNKLKSFERGS